MEIEPLKIEWPCCCGPHNCIVIEQDEKLDKDKIVELALSDGAFCHFPDSDNGDYCFVRNGDQQQALNWDALEKR